MTRRISAGDSTPKRLTAADQMAAVRHQARTEFLPFALLYLALALPGQVARLATAWFLRAISFTLEKVGVGLGGRWLLSTPPFLEASTLLSVVWCAWLLGRDPRAKVVCVSGSKETARRYAEACRELMGEPWYRRLFPDTQVQNANQGELRTSAGGGRFSASVRGGMPAVIADVLIIDEPMTMAEARSDAVRAQRHATLADAMALFAGRNPAVSVVGVSPRTHVDDLAGRLLNGAAWEHLELPAFTSIDREVPVADAESHIWSSGQPLDSTGYPLPVLSKTRKQIGAATFAARFQQRPSEASGTEDRGWPRYAEADIGRTDGSMRRGEVMSWVFSTDPDGVHVRAASAFVAGEDIKAFWRSKSTEATAQRNRKWVVDVTAARVPLSDLQEHIASTKCGFGGDIVVVEADFPASGLLKHAYGVKVASEMSADQTKSIIAQHVETGRIIMPKSAAWSPSFESELEDLEFGASAASLGIRALAQALHLIDTGGIPIQVSMYLGPVGVDHDDDDDDYEEEDDNGVSSQAWPDGEIVSRPISSPFVMDLDDSFSELEDDDEYDE